MWEGGRTERIFRQGECGGRRIKKEDDWGGRTERIYHTDRGSVVDKDDWGQQLLGNIFYLRQLQTLRMS